MATFYRCARIVSEAASTLGRIAERDHYAQLAERIRSAFNERFFDGRSDYRHHGSPQTANSMALVNRLVPPGREPAVLDRILEDLRQRGHQQTSGDIGHWYLLQALGQAGQHGEIFKIANRTNLGSYGYIVQNLWTSMPEAWDADTGASMNHCMLGHIQEWFLSSVAGIQPDPDHPGFEQFHIAPQPVGDLTWARGSYRSIRGLISSEWTRTSRGFELRVTIPANTLATVWLPGPPGSVLRVNGRPVNQLKTVRWLRQEPESAVLAVPGGHYRLESLPPPTAATRKP
jgi:hypothetical protein